MRVLFACYHFYGDNASKAKEILSGGKYLNFVPSGSDGKESSCNAGDLGLIPGWENPLEKEMATHSSILAWRIP